MSQIEEVVNKVKPEYFAQLRKRIDDPGYFQTFRLKELLPVLLSEIPELPTFENHKDWYHTTGDGYGFRNLVGDKAKELGHLLAEKLNTKLVDAQYTYCTKGYKLKEHFDANGKNSFVVLFYLMTGQNDPLILVDRGNAKVPATAGLVTGMEGYITHYVDTMSEDRMLIKYDME